MPNQNQKNLSPEELQRAMAEHEKEEFKEIEKETKHEIWIERHKDKLIRYSKWGCFILIFIIIFAIVVNIIVSQKVKPLPPGPTPTALGPKEGFKIKVEKIKFVSNPEQENTYDLLAQIQNANLEWGASKLNYRFILEDAFGNIVGEKSGQSYILPEQSRYIIELGATVKSKPENAEVQIEPKEIQKLKKFENPQRQMRASGQNFGIVDQKTKVWTDIYNESVFGFEKVELNFIIYDATDNIVGVNYTNFNAFESGTKRYVSAIWDYIIPTKIERVEAEPNVNVYESGAFMNQYGTGQSLQY